MSNTPKEQTAVKLKTAREIYMQSHNDAQFGIIEPDKYDLLAMETYATQQNKAITDLYNYAVEVYTDKIEQLENLIHSNQPPTEDKQPGERVSLEAVEAILDRYRVIAVKTKSHAGDFAENLFYQAIEEIQDLTD